MLLTRNLSLSHAILLLHDQAPDTPYEGGYYHGKVIFPSQYPFKPPSIMMSTPSGRFQTNTKLCLSMSDFHPESWNPLWSVGTILTGLLSFMSEDGMTTGSIQTTLEEKKAFARQSLAFNCKNPTFRKLFPDLVEKFESKASTSSADVDAGGDHDAEEEEEDGEGKALEKDEGKEAGPSARKGEEADKKKGAGGRGGLAVLMMASLIVAVILIIIGGGW